jgi:hypothetical protein
VSEVLIRSIVVEEMAPDLNYRARHLSSAEPIRAQIFVPELLNVSFASAIFPKLARID